MIIQLWHVVDSNYALFIYHKRNIMQKCINDLPNRPVWSQWKVLAVFNRGSGPLATVWRHAAIQLQWE